MLLLVTFCNFKDINLGVVIESRRTSVVKFSSKEKYCADSINFALFLGGCAANSLSGVHKGSKMGSSECILRFAFTRKLLTSGAISLRYT